MSERRTSIFARREHVVSGRPSRFRWPEYLVTAAHEDLPSVEHGQFRTPYGEWHARQAGSLQTACGRSAVTWRIFWTLDFSAAGVRACTECARITSQHANRGVAPESDS